MASSPFLLDLPRDLQERLEAHAEAGGKSVHDYILEALKEKVDRADWRREYLEAGAAALREYNRTGMAYSIEEVEKRLLGL